MAQVQNLLDLFRAGMKDARSRNSAFPETKASAKAGAAAGNMLPVAPTPSRGAKAKAKAEAAPRADFHAKIEKSRAKLAAKEPSPAAQDKPERPDSAETGRARKTDRAASDDRNAAHERAGIRRQDRPEKAPRPVRSRNGEDSEAHANAPEDPEAEAATGAGTNLSAEAGALDPETREAIKQGLARIGIEADDAQLNDPAFLMEILRMLQAMQLPAQDMDIAAQAEGEALPVADSPESAVSAEGTAGEKIAGEILPAPRSRAADEPPAGRPEASAIRVEASRNPRGELARLLENRIAGLEQAARETAETRPGNQAAPASTPREWQGVQVRAHADGPAPDPLPLADLDRLRVLQASALQASASQAAAGNGESAGPRTELVLESDSADPVSETSAPGPAEAGKGEFPGGDADAQADLTGRDGEGAAGAAPAAKEGASAVKDAQGAPHFQHALEQARAADRHSAAGQAAEGRHAPHEAAVLDQIARKMAAITRKSGEEISIQLAPEHLGKVRVSLEMKEGGMAARIAVENESVRKQVEANLSTLKDALKDQGVQLQGLEVSVDQRQSSLFNPDGSNAESFFRRQGRGEGAAPDLSEAAPLEDVPETDTGRRWGYNTLEFIG